MSIAVLISGGVDSAVVVHKLKEEGHDAVVLYPYRNGHRRGRLCRRRRY